MSTKTTVYLDPSTYADLKRLAKARGVKTAFLVREAVAEYAARHGPTLQPKSIGIGRSGLGTLSERAEELLGGMGEPDARRRRPKR